jgi:uncharacterized membrane protein YgcG
MKFTSSLIASTVTVCLASAIVVIHPASAKPYSTVHEFPLPVDNSAVADPDGFLSEVDRLSLDEKIQLLCQNLTVAIKGSSSEKKQELLEVVPVQLAVAIVHSLITETAFNNDEDVDILVEHFTLKLHDKWGIGHQTEQGGTGVLLLLDVVDREIFISRGGALDNILTNHRLRLVISGMKVSMQQARYAVGLLQAVESIVRYVEIGEPTVWEQVVQMAPDFLFAFFVASYVVIHMWKLRRCRRAYARVKSRLTEMDRARAEALQGNFQPQTTCSICLEKFKSDKLGSDCLPIKLLRCGHVFDRTCWFEWVTSGQGDVTKCPICRVDVGSNVSGPADSESDVVLENGQQAILSTTLSANVEDSNLAEQNRDDAMRLHQQERHFRLLRLSIRYPEYMSSDQVSRYTSPTYNGRMAQDRSFEASDPVRSQCQQNRSDLGAGFGGGLSSGGVGGRF